MSDHSLTAQGRLYESGRGVERSIEAAAGAYRKAADKGHADAQAMPLWKPIDAPVHSLPSRSICLLHLFFIAGKERLAV